MVARQSALRWGKPDGGRLLGEGLVVRVFDAQQLLDLGA